MDELYLNYYEINGKDIAKAMNNATFHQLEEVKIYNWKEMTDLVNIGKHRMCT